MRAAPATIRGHRAWLRALRRVSARRAVILGYHGISASLPGTDLWRLLVDPGRFRAQLELMLAAGFRFTTVAELARRAAGHAPPPGLAVVSFDDGMRNNHSTALPILRELGIPATVYVTAGLIAGQSPWIGPGGDGKMLDRTEIVQLAEAGWEIGAHTMTHPDLSTMGYQACRAEMEASRDVLRELTGSEIPTFAYPFGRYGPAAVRAAADIGFLAAVTTGSGSWKPLELTRAMISTGDPFAVTMLKATDRYEPLLRTPPLRLARDASRRLREHRGRRQAGP